MEKSIYGLSNVYFIIFPQEKIKNHDNVIKVSKVI